MLINEKLEPIMIEIGNMEKKKNINFSIIHFYLNNLHTILFDL